MVPKELKYTKEHEWVKVEGNVATIGITDHAQSELGDIVFVEMPQIGASVAQMKEFGVVESVKTVSNLYAPVTGTVESINDTLSDKPETVNADPYGDGWIIKVTMSDPSEVKKLLTAEAYEKVIKT